MNDNLKPCPFCGGKAKLMARQQRFCGKTYGGKTFIRWAVYIKCNRCHSRGKPIITKPMEESFYRTGFYKTYYRYGIESQTLAFKPYVEEAIEKWNRRAIENDRERDD